MWLLAEIIVQNRQPAVILAFLVRLKLDILVIKFVLNNEGPNSHISRAS